MAIETIYDSPVLQPIAIAAEEAGLDVTLFGSVASRAMLLDAAGHEVKNLFQLTEHASDIDIAHSGTPSDTRALKEAIARNVTVAPWLRWSIIDRDQFINARDLQKYNIDVPIRRLELGLKKNKESGRSYEILLKALNGEVDFIDNEGFDLSPRAKFDTKISACLMYVDALADVLDAQRFSGRSVGVVGSRAVRDLVARSVARLGHMTEAGKSAALRRAWYRFASLAFRVPDLLFLEAQHVFGLMPLISALESAGYPAGFLELYREDARTLTRHRAESGFRIPPSERLPVFEKSLADQDALYATVPDDSKYFSSMGDLYLEEGNEVVAILTNIPVVAAKTSQSPDLDFSGSVAAFDSLGQEFIYISMPITSARLNGLTPDRLTAIVFAYSRGVSELLPAFASVSMTAPLDIGIRADGFTTPCHIRCTVRLNLSGMLDDCEKIDVLLVGRVRA